MMHETIRRRVCRAVFVCACLVPTFFVLGWTVSRYLPGRAEATALSLSQRFGLAASVAEETYPKPGAVLHRGVELKDIETGANVLRARIVESWSRGGSMVLSASQVEIQATTLAELWRIADRMLRDSRAGETTQLQFVASDVTWRGNEHDQTFTGLEGSLGSTGAEKTDRELTLRVRLAGVTTLEPITVRIVRRRGARPGTTSLMLRTGDAPLPAALFEPWLDANCFGPRAAFRGYVAIDLKPGGWEGELSGTFADVDLSTLTAGRLPHVCTGRATLSLDRAKLREGRIVEAAGSLTSGPGTIGRSLVISAGESLGLFPTVPPTLERVERYEQLACKFLLNERGITLHGLCKNTEPGAILLGGGSASTAPLVLWREPGGEPQSCVALLRAIAPDSDVDVPATRETEWLIRHLPLAPAMASDAGSEPAKTPEARLQLVPPRSTR